MLRLGRSLSKVFQTTFASQRAFSDIVPGQTTTVSKQYDPSKHSLLKDIFAYQYAENYLGYIIKESKTNSLILVDPGNYEIAARNVQVMEAEQGLKLRYIFSTHHHERHNGQTEQFLHRWPEVKIVAGNYGTIKPFNNKLVDEIKPFEIGELSVCLFHTPGHTDDSCTFILHHVTPDSTKTPVMFTGDTLYIGSCGKVYTENYAQMYQTLNKLKTLPNETLLFPSHNNAIHNLLWVKTLDPKNQFLKMKLMAFERAVKEKQFCVPSLLLEERKYNPFLRCNEKYFSELMEEKDPLRIFTKLKKAQDMMFKL